MVVLLLDLDGVVEFESEEILDISDYELMLIVVCLLFLCWDLIKFELVFELVF